MFDGVVPHELRRYAAVGLPVAQRLAMIKVLGKLIRAARTRWYPFTYGAGKSRKCDRSLSDTSAGTRLVVPCTRTLATSRSHSLPRSLQRLQSAVRLTCLGHRHQRDPEAVAQISVHALDLTLCLRAVWLAHGRGEPAAFSDVSEARMISVLPTLASRPTRGCYRAACRASDSSRPCHLTKTAS